MRLVAHMAPPSFVLRGVGLDTLRDTCRDIGAAVSGAKEDLIERIVRHVGAERDLVGEPELPPPPKEPRRLSQTRFCLLFEQFRGLELATILAEFDLRRSGTKQLQASTLWDAQRSEATLLSCLTNLELEVILRRLDLKPGGSKPDRIERLVQHFASLDEVTFQATHVAARAPLPSKEGPVAP